MAEHKYLYIYSLDNAVKCNERDLWRESYKENCNCARAIEKAIAEGYDYEKSHLNDTSKPIVAEYGFDRVNFVLANTLKEKNNDGRFSYENKEWASSIYVPKEDINWHFCVGSHPGLTDIFLNQTRKAWQELKLFDNIHCMSEKDGEIDYENKLVVIRPDNLKDEYKTPDDQLFYATGGFGCVPNSRGQKVYGYFIKDGEKTYYPREKIIGVLKEEFLPEWAAERLVELNSQAEGESSKMTMK